MQEREPELEPHGERAAWAEHGEVRRGDAARGNRVRGDPVPERRDHDDRAQDVVRKRRRAAPAVRFLLLVLEHV